MSGARPEVGRSESEARVPLGRGAVQRSQAATQARTAGIATPVAIGLGLLALLARVPSTWAVGVTAGVGVVGLIAPVPDPPGTDRDLLPTPAQQAGTWVAALSLGLAALLAASRLPALLGLGPLHGRLVVARPEAAAVIASVMAAIAEEAFFRRLMYGWLHAQWGPGIAIVVSAVSFAAIHVPVYGVAVLPIDTAAGLLLGWQRWMTGGWTASGLTHAAANLIAEGVL